MAIAQSFRALELYDLLANLVPGGVFLLGLGFVFQIEQYLNFSTGTVAAGVFLVSALVVGHMVQAFASTIDGDPTLFGTIIRISKGEDIEDVPITISHVEESIWPLMRNKFDLPEDFEDYGTMFRLLLSYVETTPATRSLRFQAIHSFCRSMWAVWHLVIVLAIVGILAKCTDFIFVRSWSALGLVLVGGAVGVVVFKNRKEKFNQRFVQYAIVDFYTDQVERIQDTKVGQTGS